MARGTLHAYVLYGPDNITWTYQYSVMVENNQEVKCTKLTPADNVITNANVC